MTNFKQRALDFLEIEWGTWIGRFNRLPVDEGIKRVKDQGYERFHDLLAHVLSWWEEGVPIIMAIAENREYARKKYDIDAFNAEAIAKYKDWDETEFLAHFEQTRRKFLADLKSINDEAWENRRLQGWFNAIFIHHAREHVVALSRFLTLDILETEWATYAQDFEKIEDKESFLKNQGVESFHDLLAHVTGWWEEGARIVKGILYEPNFKWTDPETDAFNVELTKKYASWSDAEILRHYEATRAAMIELVKTIPDEAFLNPDIEGWLAADVVGHYDGHNPGS
jgi:hypothetical protein